LKRLLSYLIPTQGESVEASILPGIEVNINNGKVHIDGKEVNYSFGSLHYVFRKAIRLKSKIISQAKNALILGFGAGSIAKILWNEKNYPIKITGVDFEPMMFALAKKHAGIRDFEQLQLVEADASHYMSNCNETFDVIFIDLFVEDQIPEFCITEHFLKQIKTCLSDKGIVIWNTLTKHPVAEQVQSIAIDAGFISIKIAQVTKDNSVLNLL
jgi:ubiquinone/menaquinone biosynthesis C-methylase UbiE